MKRFPSIAHGALFLLGAVLAAVLYLICAGRSRALALAVSDTLTLGATLALSLYAWLRLCRCGFFDGVGYAVSYATRRLLPFARAEEDFYSYRQRKRKRAPENERLVPLLTAGILLLLWSIAATLAFYSSSTDTTPGI